MTIYLSEGARSFSMPLPLPAEFFLSRPGEEEQEIGVKGPPKSPSRGLRATEAQPQSLGCLPVPEAKTVLTGAGLQGHLTWRVIL